MKPKAEKQVQIPVKLLQKMYALANMYLDDPDRALPKNEQDFAENIRSEIKDKFEKMKRHDAFSQYKSSQKGSANRESARNTYLDCAGITADFRSEKEIDDRDKF